MELHNLKPAKGSTKKDKRIARGQGSGHGGTATRGHNGAKSRSGYKTKRAFEGGQMPLQRRIPKRGFKNVNRIDYVAVNIERLQALSEKHGVTTFDLEAFTKMGVTKGRDLVKVLGSGEITATLNITAHAFSASAKSAIEAQGGTAAVYVKPAAE
jgi:large subunit ribosomal protein L15